MIRGIQVSSVPPHIEVTHEPDQVKLKTYLGEELLRMVAHSNNKIISKVMAVIKSTVGQRQF